jgi:hypothetical protein
MPSKYESEWGGWQSMRPSSPHDDVVMCVGLGGPIKKNEAVLFDA